MKDLIDEYLFHKNEEIEIVLKLVRLNNKYKQVLDKIKEELNIINDVDFSVNNYITFLTKLSDLLEEIE